MSGATTDGVTTSSVTTSGATTEGATTGGAPPAGASGGAPADNWSNWLLHVRHADDPEYLRRVEAVVARVADRVLQAAQLAPGKTLLDVGSGDGLLALRALELVGPGLSVVLADISRPLLEHARRRAQERGFAERCHFVEAGAAQLTGVADESVDAVATRSALAYERDKAAAMREFRRVLRPGGRLSLAEPVFQDEAFLARVLRQRVQAQAQSAAGETPDQQFVRLMHRWKAAQYPDTEEGCANSPIASYSERDLLRFAQNAGFEELHLELHIDVMPTLTRSWQVFLGTSPHPWAPPLGKILAEQFSPAERALFERTLRPVVESAANRTTERIVYLTARRP